MDIEAKEDGIQFMWNYFEGTLSRKGPWYEWEILNIKERYPSPFKPSAEALNDIEMLAAGFVRREPRLIPLV